MCIRMAVSARLTLYNKICDVDYSLVVCILGKHYQTKKKAKALL